MANDAGSSQSDWEAQHRQAADQAKEALLLLLRQQRPAITRVEVEYDGYGDSGQVEHICYFRQNGKEVKRPDPKLDKAVAEYTLLLLPAGWENNCGAFGTVRLDVARCKANVEHNDRYESFETTAFEG